MTGWTKAQFSVWHHQMENPLSKVAATQLNGAVGCTAVGHTLLDV